MELLIDQRHDVPHFKGLISGKLEPTTQGRDSTFTFLHALLKKAILEGKRAIVPIFFCLSVDDEESVYAITIITGNP